MVVCYGAYPLPSRLKKYNTRFSNSKRLNCLLKMKKEEKFRKKNVSVGMLLLSSVCEDLYIMVPSVAIETLLEGKKCQYNNNSNGMHLMYFFFLLYLFVTLFFWGRSMMCIFVSMLNKNWRPLHSELF